MLRKLKLKKSKTVSSKDNGGPRGAAVPYTDPDNGESDRNRKLQREDSYDSEAAAQRDTSRLMKAAVKGDVECIRQILKANGNINAIDRVGNTALHYACSSGQSKMTRYLLLHGADIWALNQEQHDALFVAVECGSTSCVGILLDYMHSIDSKPRAPFVLLRARLLRGDSYMVEIVRRCSDLKPFHKRGVDQVHIMIAHGQRSESLAVFLYSVLDVPVAHAFFQNSTGQMNMKNFQRFESKARSHSLTVLNTSLRIMEATGYEHLRCLILVSCGLVRFIVKGLESLEILDLRYNRLESLPESLCECKNLRSLKCAHNNLRRLPRAIGELQHLASLDCSYNNMKRLTSVLSNCSALKCLECNNNGLIELPVDIGLLSSMEELLANNNKIANLPLSISSMSKLRRLTFHSNPLQNIPVDFPQRAAEVKEYLKSLQDDPVANKTVKLVLVGQEGVGKTTLLKALKRTFWAIPRSPNPVKTDGINVKDIPMDDLTLRCFDCGGDVDFNETHNFFITQGALYLACFNLSEYCLSTIERSSFLLGRLQLWLQYIFSKVPNAQVVIVGTHADHELLTRRVFEEIWFHLKSLLLKAREHHRLYFRSRDRLHDCLLCQADSKCLRRSSTASPSYVNMAFSDDSSSVEDEALTGEMPANVLSFPHVVGYYEISSVKSVGNKNPLQLNMNKSIEHLKDAIKELSKRLIETNPSIPRKWANVQESLQNRVATDSDNCVATLEEVADIGKAQGIGNRRELTNMLHFMKAQGNVLFFPQLESLEHLVILDAEWLAKIFSSVISFRETGISNEGFISRENLRKAWSGQELQDKILMLLHHFGVCLPISGTNLELFPCKLPVGEPDHSSWPDSPSLNEGQLTYAVTFPSLIPPPFFSDLIVQIYRHRDASEDCSRYFSNHIVDTISIDYVGCIACGEKLDQQAHPCELCHRVHFELVAHKRTIHVTVRGDHPCCVVRKIAKLLNKVACSFEGLGTIELDTLICPVCVMQGAPHPQQFSARQIAAGYKRGKSVVCDKMHTLSDAKGVLCGCLQSSYIPQATQPAKMSTREKYDFSGCPKLFILLPVNKDGISFDKALKLFVSSLLFDGFAVHLLCEFPDGYHLTNAPGYRVRNPTDFMKQFGSHVISVLKLLRHVAGSSVSSHYADHARAVTNTIDELIKDFEVKFPGINYQNAKAGPRELIATINETGRHFKREVLKTYLHIADDKPDSFGSLRRIKFGDSLLWLCNDHYRQLRVLTFGSTETVEYAESNA